MSLWRLVYYSAVIGGWAAFFGWLPAEMLFFRAGIESSSFDVALTGAMLGAAIGVGLSIVAGMANAQWKQLAARACVGFAGGALCGALAAALGNLLYTVHIPRAFGWLIMGIGIGVVDGVYERSGSKIRNGFIGGCIGGLIGGFLFDPISSIVASSSGMTSRAIGFVILGMSIGALIGLAQLVLKEAWLTVLDGYRSGRQLILSQSVTCMGRGDHLPLPFLGASNKDVELEHVRIVRGSNGDYVVEDNRSRTGTRLNNQQLQSPTVLKDGDVIKFGANFVRFNVRQRKSGQTATVPSTAGFSQQIAPPPPPPPSKKPGTTQSTVPLPKPTVGPQPASNANKPSVPLPKPPSTQVPLPKPPTVVKRPPGPPPPPPPPRRST